MNTFNKTIAWIGLLAVGIFGGGYYAYKHYRTNPNEIQVGVLLDAPYFLEKSGDKFVGFEPEILEGITQEMNKGTLLKTEVREVKVSEAKDGTKREVKEVEKVQKTESPKEKVSLKYKVYNSIDGLTKAVEKNEVSIGAGALTIREKADTKVKFSNPFVKTGQSLLLKKETLIQNYKSLEGKNIGVQAGSTCEEVAKSLYGPKSVIYNTKSVITSASDISALVEMLKAGKIDAILVDTVIANEICNRFSSILSVSHLSHKEAADQSYGFMLSSQIDKAQFDQNLEKVLVARKIKQPQQPVKAQVQPQANNKGSVKTTTTVTIKKS